MIWRTRYIRSRALVSVADGQQHSLEVLRGFLIPAYHRAEGYQAHQGILGQQAQTHDQRVLQSLETLLLLANIDHIEEDGRGRGGSGEPILDRGVGGVQLWRDRIRGDVLVVRRERVPGQAEGTDPKPGANIDLAVFSCQSLSWAGK